MESTTHADFQNLAISSLGRYLLRRVLKLEQLLAGYYRTCFRLHVSVFLFQGAG